MGKELEDLGPASGHRPSGTRRVPKHHPAITGGEGTNKHPDRRDTGAGRREGCGATCGEMGAGRRAGLRGPWGHGPGHQARRPHMVAQAQKRMLSPGGQTPSKRQDADQQGQHGALPATPSPPRPWGLLPEGLCVRECLGQGPQSCGWRPTPKTIS